MEIVMNTDNSEFKINAEALKKKINVAETQEDPIPDFIKKQLQEMSGSIGQLLAKAWSTGPKYDRFLMEIFDVLEDSSSRIKNLENLDWSAGMRTKP